MSFNEGSATEKGSIMLSRGDLLMIKQMRVLGAHIIDIAHHVGCCERTVMRHLALRPPPSIPPEREKMKKLRSFMDYIDTRLREHVWNAEVIYQELKMQGYHSFAACSV